MEKQCSICHNFMGNDIEFTKLHNICRSCLESGQDTECLKNPNIKLSEWEQQHIRQCAKCAKYFVATWHLGTQCGVCSEPIRQRQQIKNLTLQLHSICSEVILMRDKYLKYQSYINKRMQLLHSPHLFKNTHNAQKRIERFFGDTPPFDMETLCQVMAKKKVQYKNLLEDDIYHILSQFFVEGYSQAIISDMYNLSDLLMLNLINICVYIVKHPKYNWLFQPVQRCSKELKIAELNSRITDIIESKSRIDATEIKE